MLNKLLKWLPTQGKKKTETGRIGLRTFRKWFVSGKQINNYYLQAEANNNIDLRDTDKS